MEGRVTFSAKSITECNSFPDGSLITRLRSSEYAEYFFSAAFLWSFRISFSSCFHLLLLRLFHLSTQYIDRRNRFPEALGEVFKMRTSNSSELFFSRWSLGKHLIQFSARFSARAYCASSFQSVLYIVVELGKSCNGFSDKEESLTQQIF